jgi:hypothetical protein
MKPCTAEQVDELFASVGASPVLLLLVDASKPVGQTGVPALAHTVLGQMVEQGGALDTVLTSFAADRPKLQYYRVVVDPSDSEVMAKLGVCWLPQVRLLRNDRTLFRSQVAISDSGEFLAQDVGGRSFVRRTPATNGLHSLTASLAAELDRLVRR